MRGKQRVLVGATGIAILVMLAGVQGCTSAKEIAGEPRGKKASLPSAEGPAHDLALQHFIDGSIFEMKGEHAKAILEFQDALRYEKNHAIYYALAKNYSSLNKHSLAIEAASEAVQLAPDNLEYRQTLAEVFAAAFEVDSAAYQYEEIVRRDSSSMDAWYSLARIYQSQKPLKALEVYNGMLTRFGPEWEVLLQIAELYNKMGQFEKAANALKQMTAIDPGNQELRKNLGQVYIRAGKFDEALAVFTELHEMNPDKLEYLAELGGVQLLKRDYAKATENFEKILTQDSVSLDSKLHISEMYFGQLEKDSTLVPAARSVFEWIRDQHPNDWRVYWFLGAVGTVIHDDSLSVRNFRRMTELASWNADGWVYLSSVFLGKNNFAEAAQVLERALKVLPDDFRVNFFLGVAYSRLGRANDAVLVLEHAHQLNAKDIDAIAQLALVYDGMKRYAESDSLYETALKLDPQNHLVSNNYGYSLAERGLQLERALEMAKKAVEAQPDNASYLDTIGWVYFRLGRYKEAVGYVKKAISRGDASAVVYEHLGDIYFKLDDKEQALEQWNKALTLDATNTALRDKIARGTL